ncbi:DegT/DnrJ/EryC1/StrS aminotransferase family protein [Candidatus Dependentiae bacterium]|nr:DegT/DnrJ/EryC1/StrS aminotransferase family protein [Candidatus Dependentiae bacterium]
MKKIPVYQPSLYGNEKLYVNQCLDSNWISSKGDFVTTFERKFAKYTGIQYASSICNGTCALHAALLALDIGKGDEVIVPTLTYIASVNAITYTDATPVFVDSLQDTWQMDPIDVAKKITHRTKAIMAVHLYGHPCDMEKLVALANKHNLLLIEDCAEALGTQYKNKHVGTFGDIAAYSFYGNKTITTGEGGMVVTNSRSLYAKVQKLKGQGLTEKQEYWHDIVGYNYRMTNICAAIGLAQLENITQVLKQKQTIATLYKQELNYLPIEHHKQASHTYHSYWMFSILVENKSLKEDLRKKLTLNGIETRPLFYPIHTMPMYNENNLEHYPVAQDLSNRGINLPSWPGLTKKEIVFICTTITQFFMVQKTNYHAQKTV